MKTWIAVVLVCVAVVAAGGGFTQLSQAPEVHVVAAGRQSIAEFVEDRGKTRLPRVTKITMPYAGRIETIELNQGDKVSQGQVVARINEAERSLQLKQMQAKVARIEASIRENDDMGVENVAASQAQRMHDSTRSTVQAAQLTADASRNRQDFFTEVYRRLEKLFRKGAISDEEHDRAKLDKVVSEIDYNRDTTITNAAELLSKVTALAPQLIERYIARKGLHRAVLEQELAEARAALEQMEIDYRHGEMTSPIDGVVLARPVYNERRLAEGTVLLELGRLEDLEVEAEILTQEAARIRPGCHAEIFGPAIGDKAAEGYVERIYPVAFTKVSSLGVEQQRVLVMIRFAEGELKKLRESRTLDVGYRVRVRIITDRRNSALCVPRSALFRGSEGQWMLYLVEGGRVREQAVTVGILNDQQAEIQHGLKEGDLVVVAPESDLEPSDRVQPVRRPDAEPASATGTSG